MARLREEFREPAADLAEYGVGAVVDGQHTRVFREELTREGEYGGAGVTGVEVGGEDDGVGVVELQSDRGASAERRVDRARGSLAQPARAEQPVQTVADGRT